MRDGDSICCRWAEVRNVDLPAFAGVVTRAVALATDTIVTTAMYIGVVGVVALVASLVGGLEPDWLVGTLLAAGWILIAGTYFVLFWSTAGRTPGMRLMRLRVETQAGGIPSVGRSIVRLAGLVLSIASLFIGFVPVLFDQRLRPRGLSRGNRRALRRRRRNGRAR